MGFEGWQIGDLHHFARLLHRGIPLKLGLRLGPGLLGRMPTWQRIIASHISGNLRGHHEADPACAQLGQRDGGVAAVGLVLQAAGLFAGVDLGHREPQVAVPFHRIHGQIEVGINCKHICFFPCRGSPMAAHLPTMRRVRPTQPTPHSNELKDGFDLHGDVVGERAHTHGTANADAQIVAPNLGK